MRTSAPIPSAVDSLICTIPAVFAVVGEHRADPDRLLLLGDDGRFYAYATDADHFFAVEVTADWLIDAAA